jgi:Carbohydrate-selective porin, OprB family
VVDLALYWAFLLFARGGKGSTFPARRVCDQALLAWRERSVQPCPCSKVCPSSESCHDGQFSNCVTERILEAYCSYALTPSTRLTFDYQFVDNPGYNVDRGPVNIFAAHAHWQF